MIITLQEMLRDSIVNLFQGHGRRGEGLLQPWYKQLVLRNRV